MVKIFRKSKGFAQLLVSVVVGLVVVVILLEGLIPAAQNDITVPGALDFLSKRGYAAYADTNGDFYVTGGDIYAGEDVIVTGNLTAETGRCATYVIAASDAPAHVKAQADYVCDGSTDGAVMQSVVDLIEDEATAVLTSEVVAASPVNLSPGINEITVTGAGTVNITLAVVIKDILPMERLQ